MDDTRDFKRTGLEIAVIGMAGRFPGARDLAELWNNLVSGVEAISFFPDDVLLAAGADPSLLADPRYVRARGVLDDADQFDAEFFGYSPREAEIIDPQQRLFLEYAAKALEDAGYDPFRYPGLIGVYGGVSTNTYVYNVLSHPEILADMGGVQVALANDKDFLCTRVAYKLGLEGPCVNVQTACSTSLVAVHLAAQALLGGECDMALAGGVSVSFPQERGYLYQDKGILSSDGHCRAFDARAKGTVLGSGVGIVVLKRLADALREGDSIRAVIRGSAVNNDGSRKAGFTAPRVDGQAKAICTALEIAQVAPETVTYVEAHGTGTELGDPIEVAALTQAFRTGTDRRGFCALGSVKTNIGHLDAAAGVSGLIKTILALEHKTLPPSLHFEQPNPQIDFAASPLYVNTVTAPWPSEGHPRRAGVSSFGLGGTNAHVVLEEPPEPSLTGPLQPAVLLVLSARSEAALETATDQLADWLERHPEACLDDVAYTLQVGRRELPWRRALACAGGGEAHRDLARREPRRVQTARCEPGSRQVAFVLSGLGGHYPGMARGLYAAEPVFRAELDRCAELFGQHLEFDLREALFTDPDEAGSGTDLRRMLRRGGAASEGPGPLDRTLVAQPSVFAVGCALARLWMSWGVRPQALLGYSLGEYLAAHLAEVFPLPETVELVAQRARLIEALPTGAMLAIPLAEREVRAWLAGELCLAAVNGEHLSVVSGPREEVSGLAERLRAEGIACSELATTHAFHSRMMAPAAETLAALVRRLRPAAPRIPYLSNVTGTWIRAEEVRDPEYWTRHLCGTVRFAEGLRALWEEPSRVLLEVGADQGLSALALQDVGAEKAYGRVVRSLPHRDERLPDELFLRGSLGRLWVAGGEVDWSSFQAGERRRVPLPTYPFERQRFWIEYQRAGAPDQPRKPAKKISEPSEWFHVPVWKSAAQPLSARPLSGSRWLFLLDEHGLGRELMRQLEAAGHEVVGVDGYDSLLTALRDVPDRIVHLWSLGPEESATEPESLARAQTKGFYALLSLAQALGKAAVSRPVELCAIVDGVLAVERGDLLRPERATLRSALQVIMQEYPALRCRMIDVDLRELGAGLVERLLAELAQPSPEPEVACRGGRRWIPDFVPLRLEAGQSPLREGGVYLITGGLGGIGLGLAELLARKFRAKLVLIGRSEVPERSDWPQHVTSGGKWSDTLRRLEALEALGAEILALSADVTDEERMRSVIALCLERFGGLHGVLHAAGVPGAGLIQLKTREMADQVQAPKIVGALVLARVLERVPLDFLVLFSSGASIFGGVGQVDYAAANAFLDASAEHHAKAMGRRIVAIDWCEWQWDAWTRATLPMGQEVIRQMDRLSEVYGLTFEEGLEAMCRAVASGLPQVVVLTRSFESHRRLSISGELGRIERIQSKEEVRRHSRPTLSRPYVAPRTELEQALAAIWQELFGIEQVGIEDDFLEIGGHSLLALQVISRIHERLQVDVAMNTLLEAATIACLAALLSEQEPVAEPSPGGDGALGAGSRAPLRDVDALSDEQVDGLLGEMLARRNEVRV